MVLNLVLRIINRTRSLEQIATVSTLHIKRPPDWFVIFKLNVTNKDCATTDADVSRAYVS